MVAASVHVVRGRHNYDSPNGARTLGDRARIDWEARPVKECAASQSVPQSGTQIGDREVRGGHQS